MKRHLGFTLIELLIVVAIIAILAAIAVPNFLEAQTRAKVSRVKADMRSLATAIESYRIDWNMYPIAAQWVSGSLPASNTFNNRMKGLTTPTSYITSLPLDVFVPDEFPFDPNSKPTFEYEDDTTAVSGLGVQSGGGWNYNLFTDRAAYGEYFGGNSGSPIVWNLLSAGPDRRNDFQQTPNPISTPAIELGFNNFYDPTNGTISRGDVIRTSAEQRN